MTLKSEYTKHSDIIAIANTMADLSEWTIEEWEVTPAEAWKTLQTNISNTYVEGETNILGTANSSTKTIRLFTKSVKGQGQLRWTLCHELGHAIHFQNHPNSTNWHTENKEQFADTIGLQIEDKWSES